MDPTPGIEIEKWTMSKLYSYTHKKLEPFNRVIVNRSLDLYRVDINTAYPAEYVFTSMASDIRVTCGTEILASKMAAALNNKVYRYVVTSFPSVPVYCMQFPAKFAFHGWELYAFFGTFHVVMDADDQDNDFRDVLRDNVMSFVHSGRPSDTRWKSVSEESTMVALISDKLVVNASYRKVHCDFWNQNGFFSYSWVN